MNNLPLKKSVLHIIIKSSYDGAAVYPVRLCEKIKEYDHTIISCFKGNAFEEILAKGINCENLVNNGSISYKYLLLKYWRLIKYLRKRSFDIIHYHQGGVGILLLAYFYRKKAKVIHHFHHANLIGNNKKQEISFIHLTIIKYLSTRTKQIAVAVQVYNEYSKKIRRINNLHLIKNSIPFSYSKKEQMKRSIGFIGRFTKEKGFPLVIQLAQILKSARPDLKLILMGEDSKLFSKKIKRELTNIEFMMPTFSTQKFYNNIDMILFLSSSSEGLPLVVLEAVSFNVGIIAFPVTGAIEILGKNYPLYVKNIEEVMEKLNLYYSDKINLDELSQIHERINKEFSYEVMLTAIKQLYSECLNS